MAMARKMNLVPSPKCSWKERGQALYSAISVLLLPVIILGGMYSGIFTAMEAAAVACVWALIAGAFIQRELKIAGLWRALQRTTEITAIIYSIIAAASFLSVILSYTQIPQAITNACLAYGVGPISFMLMGALACLILGTFVEVVPIMFIVIPIMAPVCHALGISMNNLYIASGTFIGLGMITPPVCVGVYTAAATAMVRPQEVLKYLFPKFFLLLMFCGLVYIFVPWFSDWLPNLIAPLG
jgi:C4-dicarboxylate transporter DctM subunit